MMMVMKMTEIKITVTYFQCVVCFCLAFQLWKCICDLFKIRLV